VLILKNLPDGSVEECDVEELKKALGSVIPLFSQKSAEVAEMEGDALHSRGQVVKTARERKSAGSGSG
jgi:hypothetical protein